MGNAEWSEGFDSYLQAIDLNSNPDHTPTSSAVLLSVTARTQYVIPAALTLWSHVEPKSLNMFESVKAIITWEEAISWVQQGGGE